MGTEAREMTVIPLEREPYLVHESRLLSPRARPTSLGPGAVGPSALRRCHRRLGPTTRQLCDFTCPHRCPSRL